ncbi:MAG: hypothetical protein ABIL74_07630 [candidate division WOR-3 bacterium]
MPKKEVTQEEKEKILKRVQGEFPRCKVLQDIHYYRYLREAEEETMTTEEILRDIKEGARRVKDEMKQLKSG